MKSFSERPNLKFLLREAKTVKARHRNGDAGICEIIGHFDISLHGMSNRQIFATDFSIIDAQRVVARQYGFSSWSRMKCFVDRTSAGRNPSDTNLRSALLKRARELGDLQLDIQNKCGDYKNSYREYRKLAQDSTRFLHTAYDCHGWPGPDVVGPDCVNPIYMVSGNAVYDAEFQFKTVRLMGEALSEGGCIATRYAQLKDRYLRLSQQPTTYGNAFGSYYDAEGECALLTSEVIDPENLDKRRAGVGHTSMESERKRYAKEAKENNWQLPSREQLIKELDQLSIDGGYLQQRGLPG